MMHAVTRAPLHRLCLLRGLRTLAIALCVAGGLSGLTAAEASAQDREPQVIELEELVIEGKVSKPQVFYILGRSRLQYQNLKLRRSFVGRIVDAANRNPF